MGYMYDNLKTLLGGKHADSKSVVNKDWTPNNIRCLIISRNFLFAGHHTGSPKVIPLNPQEVAMDLSGNSQGALHNLLSNRQLSCMEEIYVDNMFIPPENKRFMNLEMYISKLFSESSRLRFYGYCETDGQLAQFISQKYQMMLSQPNYLYSLATDKEREGICKLQYQRVDNQDWYRKYNLRPNHYALDGDKGRLAVYLRKGEEVIKGMLEEESRRLAEEGIRGKMLMAVKRDLELMPYLVYLVGIMSESCKSEFPELLKASQGVIRGARKNFYGYKVSVPEDALKGINPEAMKAYVAFKTFEKGDFNESEMEEYSSKGFLKIEDFMARVCTGLFKERNRSQILKIMLEMRAIPELGEDLAGFVNDSSGIGEVNLDTLCSFIYYATGVRR